MIKVPNVSCPNHMSIMMQLHDKQKISTQCLRDSIDIAYIINMGYSECHINLTQIMLQLNDKMVLTDEELCKFFGISKEDAGPGSYNYHPVTYDGTSPREHTR